MFPLYLQLKHVTKHWKVFSLLLSLTCMISLDFEPGHSIQIVWWAILNQGKIAKYYRKLCPEGAFKKFWCCYLNRNYFYSDQCHNFWFYFHNISAVVPYCLLQVFVDPRNFFNLTHYLIYSRGLKFKNVKRPLLAERFEAGQEVGTR